MSECPKCETEIGYANHCGCGWKRPAKKLGYIEPDRVKCCHDTCFRSSKLKVRTPTGWANFCDEHYELYFKDQAKKNCEALNLKTTAEKRAWLKTKISEISAKMRMRQPGED